MRIGRLARKSGVSRDTIRFYERRGLIASTPSPEPSNTYRDYPEETLERLRRIGEARAVGLSVADLERLFGVLESLDDDPGGAERFLDEKIAELQARIARSRRLLSLLQQTRAALRRPPR